MKARRSRRGWVPDRRFSRGDSSAEGGNLKAEYVYDGEGRRRSKKVFSWDPQTENWSLIADHLFLYDGWNLLAELSPQVSALSPQRVYVWGLDLSQTLQGAGGVGGLLCVNVGGAVPAAMFPCYDGNGNVVALVDAASGAVVAEYDYSPFGETVKAAGPAAEGNPFRFSTKYLDESQPSAFSPQPSLYYYGYRYYQPGIGRWANRDPVGERGGVNLHGFARNGPIRRVDYLGLADDEGGDLPHIGLPDPRKEWEFPPPFGGGTEPGTWDPGLLLPDPPYWSTYRCNLPPGRYAFVGYRERVSQRVIACLSVTPAGCPCGGSLTETRDRVCRSIMDPVFRTTG